jgi:hypothetical protein
VNLITIVVVVNIVSSNVKPVSEVLILNVVFVLKVSTDNQKMDKMNITPVCVVVQPDIGLMNLEESVKLVNGHV